MSHNQKTIARRARTICISWLCCIVCTMVFFFFTQSTPGTAYAATSQHMLPTTIDTTDSYHSEDNLSEGGEGDGENILPPTTSNPDTGYTGTGTSEDHNAHSKSPGNRLIFIPFISPSVNSSTATSPTPIAPLQLVLTPLIFLALTSFIAYGMLKRSRR